jgi:hypothetical protein
VEAGLAPGADGSGKSGGAGSAPLPPPLHAVLVYAEALTSRQLRLLCRSSPPLNPKFAARRRAPRRLNSKISGSQLEMETSGFLLET